MIENNYFAYEDLNKEFSEGAYICYAKFVLNSLAKAAHKWKLALLVLLRIVICSSPEFCQLFLVSALAYHKSDRLSFRTTLDCFLCHVQAITLMEILACLLYCPT